MNYSTNRGTNYNESASARSSGSADGEYQQMYFSTQMMGYNKDEVDAFSRTSQTALERANNEKRDAETAQKRAEKAVYALENKVAELQDNLRLAVLDYPPEEVRSHLPERERMALDQAYERNRQILNNANMQAESIVADAQSVLRDAERKRDAMLDECAKDIENLKEEQQAREDSWEAHRQRQESELQRKVADSKTYCDKLLADTRAEAHSILEEAKARRDQEDSDFAVNMQAKRRKFDDNIAALRAEAERQYRFRIDSADEYVRKVELAGGKVQSAFDQAARTMSEATAQAAALPSFKTLEPNLPVFAEDEDDEEML